MNKKDVNNSNVTIRSNLYVRDRETYFGKGTTEYFLSDNDKAYVKQIRGKKALLEIDHLGPLMTEDQLAQRRGGRCAHGNETTYGPVLSNGQLVSLCRCDRKEMCEHRRREGKIDCDGCRLNSCQQTK